MSVLIRVVSFVLLLSPGWAGAVQLPVRLEKNLGQVDAGADFVASGPGYRLLITATGSTWIDDRADPGTSPLRWSLLDVGQSSAGPHEVVSEGRVNYLHGRNPERWISGVPLLQQVEYPQVWPSIDMVWHTQSGRLEYDFVLQPGADPDRIAWLVEGADTVGVGADGDLEMVRSGRTVVQRRPVAWQERDGERHAVTVSYRLENRRVSLQLGPYDRQRQLVIDPVLEYASYLGGSGLDTIHAIARNTRGHIYVTGQTRSPNLPVVGAIRDRIGEGSFDAFVAKLSADGTRLLYLTYLGGEQKNNVGNIGYGIAVDKKGNAYVAGWTQADDFPTTPGAFQEGTRFAGTSDAFLSKLSPDGGKLLYSTLIGGVVGSSYGLAVAVDGTGSAYMTGKTSSRTFPTFNAAQGSKGGSWDAFVTRFSADGGALLYSTYLGGSGSENIIGQADIVVDAFGAAYVTGKTESDDFPTVNAVQTANAGGDDAFVVKISAAGDRFVYASYLGGSKDEKGQGIAVDQSGRAYVVGETRSDDFPVKKAFQKKPGGGLTDGFVTALNARGKLRFSSYLGGVQADEAHGVAVDEFGDPYVVGETLSPDFPSRNPLPATLRSTSSSDAFVTKLLGRNGRIVYSTRFGGTRADAGLTVVAAKNRVWLAGVTSADDLPTIKPVQGKPTRGTDHRDGFIARILDPGKAGIGAYDPATGRFMLRRHASRGRTQIGFPFGPRKGGWTAFRGDWNGNGAQTVGLYHPRSGRFLLSNRHRRGKPAKDFRFGPKRVGLLPVAGDWNGNGKETVGVYDPASGLFRLAVANRTGTRFRKLRFGPRGAASFPVAADWNGNGKTSVGVYDARRKRFLLRNRLSSGPPQRVIAFGVRNWRPLVGDWDRDGTPGLGVYNPNTGKFLLRNALSPGPADLAFVFGKGRAGWQPLSGDW